MATDLSPSDDFGRYVRQTRFPPLGEEGQRRLGQSRVLICGCGALGSVAANLLVRAGVGAARIVDRDFVVTSNLHRQVLFDEQDAVDQWPKAIAAAEKLRRINSRVEIEPVVADVDHRNVERLMEDVDVVVDGTDNFETRFLINDAAVKNNIPWVYGGCLGAEGQAMTILPRETACLRCLIHECPPPGSMPTCDTAGVLGPIVGVIASIEAIEALKILGGHRDAVSRNLTVVDLWDNRVRQVNIESLRQQVDCPTCKHDSFPWLAGIEGGHSAVLCGRNAVQLSYPGKNLSLDDLARSLRDVGQVTRNPYLLRLVVEPYQLTIFADGRAIVAGTADPAVARTLYARYVGN